MTQTTVSADTAQQTEDGPQIGRRAYAPGTRNADLQALARLLEEQQTRKLDVVLNAEALTAQGGNLVVSGAPEQIDENGVTVVDGIYRPTSVADEGISEKLRIPLAYLRRMRAEYPDLYDLNVSGWLEKDPERRFMLRAFRAGEGRPGIVRALLSDRYKIIENLDQLVAAMDGVQRAGLDPSTLRISCDLTDRRMVVRVESRDVELRAPELLKGYRSPFTGQRGDELPLISAGFVITNSEVGGGALSVAPRATIQVCNNGLTESKDLIRTVHTGIKHDDGLVRMSGETVDRTLALVTARTKDAVESFLSPSYWEAKLQEIEGAAGTPVTDPAKTVEVVSKHCRFSDTVKDSVLAHFIGSGQYTAGGVMNAITAAAQTMPDADAAYEMENSALPAMYKAAATANAS